MYLQNLKNIYNIKISEIVRKKREVHYENKTTKWSPCLILSYFDCSSISFKLN